jgi:general secretion pathway protein F
MIEAGEKSGNLSEVLFQASKYFQSIADLKRKILYIIFYPAILTILAAGVLVFLVKLMVPPYIEMYSGFHIEFPPSLQLLVTLEEFLRVNAFWTASFPAGLVALAALVLVARRSEAVRTLIDRLVLRIPIWGEMTREVVLASSFSTLTILLRSGVPLYESLKVAKDLISNRPLRNAFDLGADEVLEGQPFSVALVRQPIFPLEVAWVVRNGEARGDLIDGIEKAQHTCQSRFEFSSQLVLSVLEPALLIFIGAIIVSITISLFYPLYSLSTHFGI